ncbi:MAG: hypothetical protein ACMZ66_16370 [Thalassospira sp.]|uniref:hypothetical protein n=1 Tax=Thalassospira sp. TaxID=1912094 RepID=UPI003A853E5D
MLSRVFRPALTLAVEQWRFQRALKRPSGFKRTKNHSGRLEGRYLLSTDQGLILADSAGVYQITTFGVFGLAIDGDAVYVAALDGEDSVVFVGHADAITAPSSQFEWRELYRVSKTGHSGRIHQICVCNGCLWLSNTAQNSLVKIDRFSGAWMGAFAPFKCSFGHPILTDHNHVNAVSAFPNFMLFGAFRANRQSAFGVCGAGEVRLYLYKNMGIHDCVISGNDLFFSDSYRMFDNGVVGGCICVNGEYKFSDYFDENPAGFVRGLAGTDGELVVGNSVTGPRAERFNGRGELIVFGSQGFKDRFNIPAAQVYDIIRLDGTHFDNPAMPNTFSDACSVLERALGPPAEVLMLSDLLVGPSGSKKFSVDDRGDISEYGV